MAGSSKIPTEAKATVGQAFGQSATRYLEVAPKTQVGQAMLGSQKCHIKTTLF
jgi:hypothetical protein